MTIRLMIVDDHDLVREGLRLVFAGTDVDVVAEAADGQAAFEMIQRQTIDVALVDLRMPRADGFQFLEMLRAAGLKLPVVLMHSVQDGAQAVRRCQELGAKGLLHKSDELDLLIESIRKVHAGQELWGGQSSSPTSR